ncbi:hypothetical protein Y032_0257g388 [Ancylostoma ceylanicum]|uniref:Uncharacterized protein n=1 Tax=Ancylostoma ceylanicum TaxID=53326 RepID=A0A016SAR9_9BILA|nr:hypothetical protein Y032_0257g388 [Ancylostoma ceylanicum]
MKSATKQCTLPHIGNKTNWKFSSLKMIQEKTSITFAPTYNRSKKYLPLASTTRLLSRAAPPLHYHTWCDMAQ